MIQWFWKRVKGENILNTVSDEEWADTVEWSLITIAVATLAIYGPVFFYFLANKPFDWFRVIKSGELLLVALGLLIPAGHAFNNSTTLHRKTRGRLFVSIIAIVLVAWAMAFLRFTNESAEAIALTAQAPTVPDAKSSASNVVWGHYDGIRVGAISILVLLFAVRYSFIGRILEYREYNKKTEVDPEREQGKRMGKIEEGLDARRNA